MKIILLLSAFILLQNLNSARAQIIFGPTSAPNNSWAQICCSYDGRVVYAGDDTSGHVWQSQDSGVTWSTVGIPFGSFWGVACSANGTNVLASGRFFSGQ